MRLYIYHWDDLGQHDYALLYQKNRGEADIAFGELFMLLNKPMPTIYDVKHIKGLKDIPRAIMLRRLF